ncbi:target of Myb1 membrane trafficking protein isoform X2 [Latimeria chalumnae]|uniref:target of Myb1 membrane trafficking protein isoform X2 n=1 Tax=Latimeria chalumnae TaxID=7897 RepID=UPI00313EF9CC
MEFLVGNPFSSPVGQRIEKATDGFLQSEDWGLNMEICDIINETEEGPKDAIRALKKRIVGNKNFREVLLTLIVLETCVKNCGHRFHYLVASRDFVEGVLVKTILPKNNPPNIVQDKVLNLIQAWADAFRSSPDLTGVVSVYEELKRKGLEFPMTDLDSLSPIHTPQRSVPDVDPAAQPSLFSTGRSPQRSSSVTRPAAQETAPAVAAEGPISPSPEQVAKLRSELEVVSSNVKVMSEMLAEMVPGQADPSDLELLQELNRTCRAMQQRVLELIPQVAHEQVTEELLHTNDDLNNVFLRYDRFERCRTGQNVPNRVPIESETEERLINLNLNTPATPPPAAPDLMSQLAGLNMTSDSVSGTLKSLNTYATPASENDGFDMFAQTRGSSLAEQRKSVKYEEPQAVEGLAGALDTRQQNTGATDSESDANKKPLDNWMVKQGMVRTGQHFELAGRSRSRGKTKTVLEEAGY